MQILSSSPFTIRKLSTTELSLRRGASLLRTPDTCPERKAATWPQHDAQDSHRWPPRRGSSCAYSQPRLEQPRWIDHVPVSPCRAAPSQPLMQIDTGCLDAWGVDTAPNAWGVSPSRVPLARSVSRPSSASTLASAPPPASVLASLPTPASTFGPTPLPTAPFPASAPPADSASTGPMFPGFRSFPGYPASTTPPTTPPSAPHPASITPSTTPPSATFLAFCSPGSIGEEIVRRRPVCPLYHILIYTTTVASPVGTGFPSLAFALCPPLQLGRSRASFFGLSGSVPAVDRPQQPHRRHLPRNPFRWPGCAALTCRCGLSYDTHSAAPLPPLASPHRAPPPPSRCRRALSTRASITSGSAGRRLEAMRRHRPQRMLTHGDEAMARSSG